MMDYIIRALKDDWIDVFSPYFVDEMGDLERDEYKQSLKATFGGHDDLFVAMGQIFFSMFIMDARAGRLVVPVKRGGEKDLEQTYFDPVWSPGFQGSDGGISSMREDGFLSENSELEERLKLYED